MTGYQQLFSGAAALLVIVSFVPYVASIIRGQTKPSKATWIIWASLANITAAGMWSAGTLNAQIAVVALGDLGVLALALMYGAPGWTKLEIASLVGAAIGILGWIVTRNPVVGIVIAQMVTLLGTVPTLVKTWHFPEQEDPMTFGIMVVSSFCQVLAIPAWSPEAAIQPFVFLVIAASVLFLILVPVKRYLATV